MSGNWFKGLRVIPGPVWWLMLLTAGFWGALAYYRNSSQGTLLAIGGIFFILVIAVVMRSIQD